MATLRIGIVGDFDRRKHSHWATEAALFHAAGALGVTVEPRWVPTSVVAAHRAADVFSSYHALWGAPGSPYQSATGMLRAIEFARTRNVPFLGTCGGFQYALIEITRHVLGLLDADTAEAATDSQNIVITPVACEAPAAGGPKLDGAGVATPVPGTLLHRLCGGAELAGEFFCNFEANLAYLPRWEAFGLKVAAHGQNGELRAFELPENRFFVGTLFQPQLSSSPELPHPLVMGLLRAASRATS